MKDIQRNPRVYRVPAVCFWIIALFPLYLGVHPLTFLPADQWSWVIVPLGIAAALIGLGVCLWQTSAKAGVTISFQPGGFHLDVIPILGRQYDCDLEWSDIREVSHAHGGYAVQWFEFLLSHEGALRVGLVKESTRENAMLVDRRIRFGINLIDVSRTELISRLVAAATVDGYTLERAPGRVGVISRDRWIVRKRG